MFLLENAFAKEKSLEERKTDATLLDLQNATTYTVSPDKKKPEFYVSLEIFRLVIFDNFYLKHIKFRYFWIIPWDF